MGVRCRDRSERDRGPQHGRRHRAAWSRRDDGQSPGSRCHRIQLTGTEQSFTHAPEEYATIHFHDDDLADANWETDFTWTVPADLDSGVYAVHLRTADDETYVPFFVQPGPDADRADVAFLVPTTTYTAYADEHAHSDHASFELVAKQMPIVSVPERWPGGVRKTSSSVIVMLSV